MGSIYQINLTGAIYSTNANVPQVNPTSFFPFASINRSGSLAIEAPIANSVGNPSNGSTLAEVGLFSGTESDFISGNGGVGTLRFTTNTALHTEFSGGGSQLAGAAVEIAKETFDQSTRILDIQIDSSLAPSNQLNGFLKDNAGILANPEEIYAGEIKIQFSADFRQVSGMVSLLGNGYIYPGVYVYAAQFTGNVAQTYQGLAEASAQTAGSPVLASSANETSNISSPSTSTVSTPTILTATALNQTLQAGSNNSVLNGQVGNDLLIGGTGSDTLIAGPGDTLTGGQGANQFAFTGTTKAKAIASSQLNSPVHITDFNYNKGDKFHIAVNTGQSQSVLPSSLFNVGVEKTHTLKQALQKAYADKLPLHKSNQRLKVNEAVFLKWHQQTYLTLKGDHGGGFLPQHDLVVNVTGISFKAVDAKVGAIPASNYFV